MTTDKQSTPITPDGLRGLGMNLLDCGMKDLYRLEITPMLAVEVNEFHSVFVADYEDDTINVVSLGTAPDLEWVAAMIDLLKRANGEG